MSGFQEAGVLSEEALEIPQIIQVLTCPRATHMHMLSLLSVCLSVSLWISQSVYVFLIFPTLQAFLGSTRPSVAVISAWSTVERKKTDTARFCYRPHPLPWPSIVYKNLTYLVRIRWDCVHKNQPPGPWQNWERIVEKAICSDLLPSVYIQNWSLCENCVCYDFHLGSQLSVWIWKSWVFWQFALVIK